MIETGVAVAAAATIIVGIIRFVPQRTRDNGFVKKETHDLQFQALDKSVCRVSSEVTKLRDSFGTEFGSVKESIGKLSVEVAAIGATKKG